MKITCLPLLVLLTQPLFAQSVLMPDHAKLNLPDAHVLYLPEDGINLYHAPGGTHIGRLRYQQNGAAAPKLVGQPGPKVQRLAELAPRDNRPNLVPLPAFWAGDNHCYYVPVARVEAGYALLFDGASPPAYWASIAELARLGYSVSAAPALSPPAIANAGILMPDFGSQPTLPRENYVYAPTKPVALFPGPDAPQCATLSRFCPVGRFSDGHMRMYVLPDSNPNHCQLVELNLLHHWSDDAYMLQYSRHENGRVCLFSMGGVDYWCNVSNLAQAGLVITSWADYFIQRQATLPLHTAGQIVLRQSPYPDAKVTHTFSGDFHDIYLIAYDDGLYFEGNWCRVRVNRYRTDPCLQNASNAQNLIETVEGWMQVLDDQGRPLVFHNPKGC